jgi:hypothetical protein
MDILRISLAASESPGKRGGQSEVVFDLLRRGEVAFRFSAPARLFGLAGRSEYAAHRFRYTEPDFKLPPSLIGDLRKHLRPPRGNTLWIELDPPGGRLSFVPWEDLLLMHVPGQVLRLPRHSLFGDALAQSTSDVVLCASEPKAKEPIQIDETVPEMAAAILNGAAGPTTVHIFADQKNYDQLAKGLRARGLPWANAEGGDGVRLYNPAEAKYDPAEFSKVVEDDAELLDNPWLKWMADSLPGRAIGVVHFLCHGYFSAEQGALAFAESPSRDRDANWARFVGARQINTFLDRVGASAVAFASPPRNYSILGLRLLVSQLASLRPGATFMHGVAPDLPRLGHLPPSFPYNAFIFYRLLSTLPDSPGHSPSPRNLFWSRLRASCFYCPPSLVYREVRGELAREASEELPETTKVIYALGRLAEGGGAGSGWMTSGSNVIKRAALDLVGVELTSERQLVTHAGARKALEFVSDVLRRHAGVGGDYPQGEDEG